MHCDTYGKYLSEIGGKPLLTDEEEITLGRQVQAYVPLRDAKAALTEELGRGPTLEEWAEATGVDPATIKQTVRVGERACKRMMEGNLRLVCAVVKKYQRRNMEILDLVQEGNLGLARAVEKFDPGKGYRFSTYAYWWIRQAITRAIHNDSRQIRLPIHISETLIMAKIWVAKYVAEHNRLPPRLEVVEYLQGKNKLRTGTGGTTEDALAMLDWYLEVSRPVGSLNYVPKGPDEDGTELIDFMLDDGADGPEDFAVWCEMKNLTVALIEKLPRNQREILVMRFGLDDGREKTLAQVARCMNLSRERVRQLQNLAMRSLRRDTHNTDAVELVKTA